MLDTIRRENFHIGWICALPHELAASRCMLDEEYPQFTDQKPGDDNVYLPGRIGRHFVVLACLPDGKYGTISAATTASNMLHSFPRLRFGLMVGIGGAVPGANGIRLGDVAVSRPTGSHGGVIQYNSGKATDDPNGEVVFENRGHLNSPPRVLLSAIQGLRSAHEFRRSKISQYISEMLEKHPEMKSAYGYPGPRKDPLYHERFSSDGSVDLGPSVFYGLIASGDWVIASVRERERLIRQHKDILCFEMEATGLMDSFPCLIIRGMSDYADATKSDGWQRYAAAAAAAYAKELLEVIPVTNTPSYNESMYISQDIFQKCLLWLKYPNSKTFFDEAYSKRTPATGDWFLTKHLDPWKQKGYSFLWMYGKAGCGKTVLCSTVTRQILDTEPLVAYFYFSYRRTEAQGLQQLLHALVIQLVRASTKRGLHDSAQFALPRGFQQLYDQYMLESEPTIEDLKTALLEILKETRPCFILIDGLDECEPAEARDSVLQFLQWLHERHPDGTHVMITSRLIEDIEATIEDLESFPGFQKLPIENSSVNNDINMYAQHYLKNISPYRGWTEDVKEMVLQELGSRSHGVFRWAECQLKELRSIETRPEILAALRELPQNLDETYARMLQKVRSSKYSAKAFAALQWLAFSKKPLTVKQLAETAAFNIEEGLGGPERPKSFDIDNRFLQPMRFCHLLGGLVVVGGQSLADVEVDRASEPTLNSEISFAHYSVLEYLLCPRVDPSWRLSEGVAHRLLFESCSLYIQHYTQAMQSSQSALHAEHYPLLAYTCRYWIDHFKGTFEAGNVALSTKQQFQELFSGTGKFFLTTLKVAFGRHYSGRKLYYSDAVFCSPAYFLAMHDLSYGVSIFPDENHGIGLGVSDLYAGKCALHIACSRGHVLTMVALLDAGANINQKSTSGSTALHYGARAGSVEVVMELLSRVASLSHNTSIHSSKTVSPVVANNSVHNPGIYSSSFSTTQDVDMSALNEDYETVLHSAVRAGNATIVQMLLNCLGNLHLETRNVFGLTPLHLAVRIASWAPFESLQTIRSLLEAGADTTTASASGYSILREADQIANKDLICLLNSDNAMSITGKESDESWRPDIYPALQKTLWVDEDDSTASTLLLNRAYSAVFYYCTRSDLRLRHGQLRGQGLYEQLLDYIDHQLHEIQLSDALEKLDRDKFYLRMSSRWLQFAAFATRMFNYLQKHFVQQQMEGRILGDHIRRFYRITPLCLKRWKEIIGAATLPSNYQLRSSEDGDEPARSDIKEPLSTYFDVKPVFAGLADWASVHIFTTGLILDYYLDGDAKVVRGHNNSVELVPPRNIEVWIRQKLHEILDRKDDVALRRFYTLSGVLCRYEDGTVGTSKFDKLIKAIRHFDWNIDMGEHKWSILREYLAHRGFRAANDFAGG